MTLAKKLMGANPGAGWDVINASFLSVGGGYGQSNANGFYFRPDGLEVFVLDSTAQRVFKYSLSSPWTVIGPTLAQTSASLTFSLTGLSFRPDGLRMYISDAYLDQVKQYNLSSAWDLSTAVYNQAASTSAQTYDPANMFFRDDGLKMYVGSPNNLVAEYDLGTAWEVSTASLLHEFVASSGAYGVFFKPDGLRVYITQGFGYYVNQYNLSAPWNISTAVYQRRIQMVSGTTLRDVFFRPDGRRMFTLDGNKSISEYSL